MGQQSSSESVETGERLDELLASIHNTTFKQKCELADYHSLFRLHRPEWRIRFAVRDPKLQTIEVTESVSAGKWCHHTASYSIVTERDSQSHVTRRVVIRLPNEGQPYSWMVEQVNTGQITLWIAGTGAAMSVPLEKYVE